MPINLILWFNVSPQSRYGGFAVSITLTSFIAAYFFVNYFKIKNFILKKSILNQSISGNHDPKIVK